MSRAAQRSPGGPGSPRRETRSELPARVRATVSAERQPSTVIFWEATKEGSIQTRKARVSLGCLKRRERERAGKKLGAGRRPAKGQTERLKLSPSENAALHKTRKKRGGDREGVLGYSLLVSHKGQICLLIELVFMVNYMGLSPI